MANEKTHLELQENETEAVIDTKKELQGFDEQDLITAMFMHPLHLKKGSITQTLAMKHPERCIIFLTLNSILRL